VIKSKRGAKITAKQKAIQILKEEIKELTNATYYLTSRTCKTETEEELQEITDILKDYLEKFNNVLE